MKDRYLIAFMFLTQLVSTPAFAKFDSENLKGAHGIDSYEIFVSNLSDPAAAQCNLSEDAARASVVNILLPAGVPIKTNLKFSTGEILVWVPTLNFGTAGLCVSSIIFQVLRFVIYPWQGQNVAGLVELFKKSVILSDAQIYHRDKVNAEIAEFAREFLAFWRQANPETARAPLIRSEPYPRPTISSQGGAGSMLSLSRTQIVDVQNRLRSLGLYAGTSDGVIGPATRAALISFQASSGLAPTGSVDWITLQTLFQNK